MSKKITELTQSGDSRSKDLIDELDNIIDQSKRNTAEVKKLIDHMEEEIKHRRSLGEDI